MTELPTQDVALDFPELAIIADTLEKEVERNNRRIVHTIEKARMKDSTRSKNIRADARQRIERAESAIRKINRAICEHARPMRESLASSETATELRDRKERERS